MSVFKQLECLEAKGLIQDGQMDRVKRIAASLPTTQADLLAIIAATSLVESADDLLSLSMGTQQVLSSNSADVKSLNPPSGATRAIISVHENNIIFRLDSGIPSPSMGHFAEKEKNFTIGALNDFKFISVSETDAVIFVTYY